MAETKTVAKRPDYSDIEEKENRFSHICDTCWQPVRQPCIKGLWYHDDDHVSNSFDCKNLVPKLYSQVNRDKATKCLHEFRFNSGLGGAVKCIKCNYPMRIDMYELEDYRKNYFCLECKKNFKILKQHYRTVHNCNGFEYNLLPTEKRDYEN